MRTPRLLREGARYHVTARANRKEMIFASEEIKSLFLSVVQRARKKYMFRLENFTLMGNHVHLVIVPGRGENLSAIMRWILGVFAVAFNRLHGYSGHVWGARFFSRILEGLSELRAVFAYIDNNPVRASQVDDRRDWHYGGLWYARAGRRDLIEEDPIWVKLLFPERGILSLG